MRALLITAGVVGLIIVMMIVIWFITRGNDPDRVRRRDVKRARAELDAARRALDAIEAAAVKWNDIDSVLATEVRQEVRNYENERREIERDKS